MYKIVQHYSMYCDRCNHYMPSTAENHEMPKLPEGWARRVIHRDAEWNPIGYEEVCKNCNDGT